MDAHLIEDCHSIDINQVVKKAKEELLKELISTEILINSGDLQIAEAVKFTTVNIGNGGYKTYFICPYCQCRAGKLYKHPLTNQTACRKCNQLEYKAKRFKGMI